MSNFNAKRLISMLLCLTMLFGMMPLGAFASTAPEASVNTPESGESDKSGAIDLSAITLPVKTAREHMEAVLDKYLGTALMAQNDVAGAVASMNDVQLVGAWEDAQAVLAEIKALSDAEFELLALYSSMDTFGFFYEELETLFGGEIKQYAATTLTLLDGALTVTDSIGNGTLSGGIVTIKAVGSTFSKKTNTITISNESGSKASVSFDYTASNANSFTIAGASVAVSGTYKVVLETGAAISISLQSKSGLGDKTAILTMSNISLIAAAEASNVTVNFDSALGSVTAAGSSISSGTTQNATLADGIALVATANSGTRFLGWIDTASNLVLSTSASYTLYPSADTTVEAVFAGAGSVPYFGIGVKTQKSVSSGLLGLSKIYYYTMGTTHIYSDLNAAATAAKTAGKDVVLLNDGTLPAGTYTIPAGVTLLIPFSDDNRMYTTQVENVSYTDYKTPTAYRTLTLADGADLVINGALSISAKQQCAQGARQNGGSPSGNVGFIRMQGTSNITVNNGGTLYAYGFITGSGSVTANSGATVYECFQMMDFRGGSQTTDIKNGVFPVSQYYVQNIEVPLTLYAGASEYSYTSVNMQSSDFGSAVEFISSEGAMFNLTSGYVVKRYDGATDRLVVESYGDMSVSPITMKVGTNSMDTDKYELGINSNITVSALSGTITIAQDIAMLPGSKIIVGNGVNCNIAKGVSIYVYDMDEWGGYCAPANKKLIPINYAPGKTYTRTEADLVDAEIIVNGIIDATQGYLYCTAGGANVYSQGGGVIKSKPGTQKVTYQLVQAGDVNNSTYPEIPLVPAVVKNADGTTISLTSPNGTYTYTDGVWVVSCEHVYTTTTVDATCTEAGSVTTACPCGDSTVEVIPAKGHTAGAAADCTTAQTCTVCGAELAAALGHKHTLTDSKEATCTDDGYKTYTCTCGDSYTETIAAKGHTAGAAADCTTAQTCTVCGAEIAPALGHKHTLTDSKDATCTEDGYKTYTCTCGDSYTETIAAKGHTAGAAADCTTAQTCTVCGAELAPALGHSYAAAETKAPTCTETGIMTYTCTACGDSYTEAIPATGHSLTTTTVEAGAHTLGITTVSCSGCDLTEITYTDATEGLIIYVDPAAQTAGNGTEEAPFSSYVAAFEYANGQFDATIILLGTVSFTESFTEPAHTGVFAVTGGGFAFADGVIYTAQDKLTLSDMSIEGAGEISAVELTVGEGVSGNGKTALNAADLTILSGNFGQVTGAEIFIDGGIIAGAVNVTSSATVKNGFDYKNSFTLEGAGFFGSDEAVIYVYSAFVTFADGKGDAESFSAVYDMRTDVDGDGEIANDDITVIVRFLAGFDIGDSAAENYDINCDGKINNRDAIFVIREIAFAASAANANSVFSPEQAAEITPVAAELPNYRSVAGPGETDIRSYEEFFINFMFLEELANVYTTEVAPEKDPAALIIKYIRTGVDRYNSGSWGIMAGYEDAEFAAFVIEMQDMVNSEVTDGFYLNMTGLKNIYKFELLNGDYADLGHVFGSMDITYHNKGSVNHADVSGWAGDLVDLLEMSDKMGVSGSLEEMIADVKENCFAKNPTDPGLPSFSLEDVYGDLDAYYIMETLYELGEYESGSLTAILAMYFGGTIDDKEYEPIVTEELRAEFFLKNRLGTTGTRAQIRSAVYNEYTSNKLITTLEGTRDFTSTELATLRRAVCYVFGDYLCSLAGDYVEDTNNEYFTVYNTISSNLAPGVAQDIKYATAADGQQMVYYIATADITRSDLTIYANYHNNDPTEWAMQRVLDQANAAQQKYGDPESEYYIPNYNVIASINGSGYNMQTGEPGGLLVMGGVEYHPVNASGFFGITKDGIPVIGTTEEYNTTYKGMLRDGIAGFGATLVKDGKISVNKSANYTDNRASRTAIGITATGKVVFMVLDGRQEPFSGGGSMEEIAQIMFEAGCVHAVNLDGGGSSTYVSKAEGADSLAVVNNPSDGAPRSVSTSLMIVSTAPSSTAFDHAKITAAYDYVTKDTSVQLTASGVSATGNVAELPEGCTWAVSDDRYGTISEDGVFTALRGFGSVEVYLMVGEEIVGMKTINLVTPQKAYFTKELVSAVYGSAIDLPVSCVFEGKKVAFNENDVVIKVANEAAGRIEGLKFIATENTTYKSVKVTISLAGDEENTQSIIINLFKQGENTFDFDKATGGDRQLAFLREVTNSVTEDSIVYMAVDTNESMTTSYVFAMDMTQIPIPSHLEDLIYMLPGADMENASAWNFLLQLAERVSTLTEVTPVLRFDPRFDVDYSELKIMNDYFVLEATEFDEAANTLTLRLRWIDQTQAIDPSTANPLCLVSGIKMTPKADADWGNKNRIEAVHSGEIGYNIFLRASALYSFAQKPENQEQYGLLPFVNPDIPSEKGASMANIYKEFTDTYTLVNALKNGWYNEDGGFAYYVDGVKNTGVKSVDGIYYDFGENGINLGQDPYTGLFIDSELGVYRYSKLGELAYGWQLIESSWHYFDKNTGNAAVGMLKLGGVRYEFEENGKLAHGVWVNTLTGKRYYNGPSYHVSQWIEIDGEWYYFRGGYAVTGYSIVTDRDNKAIRRWYNFGEDGICRDMSDGIYHIDGNYYYIVDGIGREDYLICVDGDYYFATYQGKLAVNKTVNAHTTNCDMPKGTYMFGPDGKMIGASRDGEIVEIDGVLYYYEAGKGVEKGLIKYNGDYYFSVYKGKIVTNKVHDAWLTNCDLPKGTYAFGPDGKMVNGIVERDGALYYYENGKGNEKGLIKFNGDYYFAAYGGKLVVNKVYGAYKTSCDLPKGNYAFGADGKMLQGIVNIDGVLYYYENGVGVEKGLIKVDGNYYFAAYKGKLVVDKVYGAWMTSCDLPRGNYAFGADGKMVQGIVTIGGELYYYENGVGVEKGLFLFDGDYYFAAYKGKLVVDKVYGAYKTSCDLPKGNYAFGADGKMVQGIVTIGGELYYYKNGAGIEQGLFYHDGNYYFAAYQGKLVTGKVFNAYKTSCDLPKGTYEFDAQGRMLQGIVERNGNLYYYENGQAIERGLFYYDGAYYFAAYKGQLVRNKVYGAYKTSCDLPRGTYEFGADGKMLDGIVEKNGTLYYYEKGVGVEKGLVYIDGHYYFAAYRGQLVVNKSYYVWEANGLLLEATYKFNELGQIVG